jgi:hypothetical protein
MIMGILLPNGIRAASRVVEAQGMAAWWQIKATSVEPGLWN